jgi:hypothetical protein
MDYMRCRVAAAAAMPVHMARLLLPQLPQLLLLLLLFVSPHWCEQHLVSVDDSSRAAPTHTQAPAKVEATVLTSTCRETHSTPQHSTSVSILLRAIRSQAESIRVRTRAVCTPPPLPQAGTYPPPKGSLL